MEIPNCEPSANNLPNAVASAGVVMTKTIADTRKYQRRKRIIDHWFVVDR